MVESQREKDTRERAAAREAAEFAAELSESAQPQDRRRVAGTLGKITKPVGLGPFARRNTAPVGTAPVGTAPAGTTPAGTMPADTMPADTTPGDTTPADAAPVGTVPAVRGTTAAAARGATAAARGAGAVARRGTAAARQGVTTAGHAFSVSVNWLTGQVIEMGPRLRVRDQATLREQFPGRTDDEIADLLIERAARASATVGGATGAWSALPALPAFPAEIAAETLAITGIEIKLVAELHEAYGLPAPGSATERARAYIASWAHRRGVYVVPGGLLLVAGSPLAGQVRRRLVARVRRSTLSLAPLFTGAVAGAMINRRETRRLGNQIREDLRRAAL